MPAHLLTHLTAVVMETDAKYRWRRGKHPCLRDTGDGYSFSQGPPWGRLHSDSHTAAAAFNKMREKIQCVPQRYCIC